MSKDLDELMQRTQGYFYEDGLVETGVGVMFLASAAVIYSWMLFEGNRALQIITALVLPLLLYLGTHLVKWMVGQLKERWVYPRTGYVSYRQERKGVGRWIGLIGALLVAVYIVVAPESWQEIAVAEGLLLGIILFYLGHRGNVVRFYVLGIAAAILGILMAAISEDDLISSVLTFGGVGLLMAVSGLTRFLTYLQQNPHPEENAG